MDVSTKEPGRYTLPELFRSADKVILARILTGDAESHSSAVYKVEVLKSYKGAKKGDTLYFGPYVGFRIGTEYLLFLRDTAQKLIVPTRGADDYFSTVLVSSVFNEGYSAMEKDYWCAFDVHNPSESCDYAVRVCTDYIILPHDIEVSPAENEDEDQPPFGCRWARATAVDALLSKLATSSR